jgi:hypothetical protein
MNGSICGVPPSVMRAIKTEREPARWCFWERKRREGTWTLKAPDMEWVHATSAYGWAEPAWSYECDGCGKGRRSLPEGGAS